jgi:hypothetical protein
VVVEWSLFGLVCGSSVRALLFLFWFLAGIGRMLPRMAENPCPSNAEDHRCDVDRVRFF